MLHSSVLDTPFSNNDIDYINDQLSDVSDRIEIAQSLLELASVQHKSGTIQNSLPEIVQVIPIDSVDNGPETYICKIGYTLVEDLCEDNILTFAAFDPEYSYPEGEVAGFPTLYSCAYSPTQPVSSTVLRGPVDSDGFDSISQFATGSASSGQTKSALLSVTSDDDTSSRGNPPIPDTTNHNQATPTSDDLVSISSAETLCKPPVSNPDCPPFSNISGSPFQLFDPQLLNSSTVDWKRFGNREVAYYGQFPYTYSGVVHAASDVMENEYLCSIANYLPIVVPGCLFNSVLITKYMDGSDHIPHHSDNEGEIEPSSDIITISLGESRTMQFQTKFDGTVLNLPVHHGDVVVMSRASQDVYTLSIPHEPNCRLSRISITFRLLKNPDASTPTSQHENRPSYIDADLISTSSGEINIQPDIVNDPYIADSTTPLGYQPPQRAATPPTVMTPAHQGYQSDPGPPPPQAAQRNQEQYTQSPHPEWMKHRVHESRRADLRQQVQAHSSSGTGQQHHAKKWNANQPQKTDTLYIGDSIFADFDPLCLSTDSQDAHVFHYNGADVARMMKKVKADERLKSLVKRNRVHKVFLLTGTNNVDSIMQLGNSEVAKVSRLTSALAQSLTDMFPLATVNIINVLPRTDKVRMDVIHALNCSLLDMSKKSRGKLVHIDTYYNGLLSNKSGRKSQFFKSVHEGDTDNPHLNILGTQRLGGHLKYLSHN